jgi:predicted DNA-binding transcriptional regulator YafY
MSRLLNRAERLRAIERLLYRAPDGMRVVEIANACEVDRRTIYRDLDLLSVGGVPIWQDEGRFGIERERYLTTVRLNFNEAFALYMAARLLARHSDEHNPHVVTALDKLATALPEPISGYIARTAGRVRARALNERYIHVLEAITLAWSLQRKVRLWYRSPRSGQVRQRDFSPYFVEPLGLGYACYVIGFDDWSGEMRTFKLERLERAQMLDETYDIPSGFDPDQYLETSWGIMHGEDAVEVVLQFSPQVASRVKESVWHPSQEIDDLKDGGCLFTVSVSEPKEMRPWIRSWGAEVEVLSPPALRQTIAEEAAKMAAVYQGIL